MPLSFDIFCRVVDNYGDIGVCWRLARQLASRSDCGPVRLWVDDLASFSRIAPALSPDLQWQLTENVHVLHWRRPDALYTDQPPHRAAAEPPADVVIEAFACSPPADYIARMSPRQLWINLEYLSAERWVEACHALPSMQASGLRKYFFFPGFTAGTGGLLREPGLIEDRIRWQADPKLRLDLLQTLGVPSDWLARLHAGARLIYIFCYPGAPLEGVMQAVQTSQQDTVILMPEGQLPAAQAVFYAAAQQGVLLHRHPFVGQKDFDHLLWSSDLNFVRGEDSLVRALWASRPMIWQPYRQADDAHLEKLDAWLSCSPYCSDVRSLTLAWNQGDIQGTAAALHNLLQPGGLQAWQIQARNWSDELSGQHDLVSRLLDFCATHSQTR